MKLSEFKKHLRDSRSISDIAILEYLYDKQGEWTCLWYGYFNYGPGHWGVEPVNDVYYAMPAGTSHEAALFKMRSLHKRKLVGGCPCGCRGDFEITDLGLSVLGKPRLKEYNGY